MGLRCAQAVVRRGDGRRRTCLLADIFGDSSIKTLAFALTMQIVEQVSLCHPISASQDPAARTHTFPGSLLAKPSTPTLPKMQTISKLSLALAILSSTLFLNPLAVPTPQALSHGQEDPPAVLHTRQAHAGNGGTQCAGADSVDMVMMPRQAIHGAADVGDVESRQAMHGAADVGDVESRQAMHGAASGGGHVGEGGQACEME